MVHPSKRELHETVFDIMATSDLNKLTTKRIRLHCEDKYQVDFTSRRWEIDKIVLEFLNSQPDEVAAPQKDPKQQSIQSSKEKSSSSDEEDQSNVMDDAAYARLLQAEEWNLRQRNYSHWFQDTPWKNEKNKEEKKKATSSTRKCLLPPALTEVLGTDQEEEAVFTTSVREAEFGLRTRNKQGSSR